MRGGHIVEERLPYRDRSGEAERVVQELKNRCAARGKAKNPTDKVHNPLIAIQKAPLAVERVPSSPTFQSPPHSRAFWGRDFRLSLRSPSTAGWTVGLTH